MQNRATHADKAAKVLGGECKKTKPTVFHTPSQPLELMGAVGDAEGAGGGVDGDHGEDVPLGPVPHERRPEDQRPGGRGNTAAFHSVAHRLSGGIVYSLWASLRKIKVPTLPRTCYIWRGNRTVPRWVVRDWCQWRGTDHRRESSNLNDVVQCAPVCTL